MSGPEPGPLPRVAIVTRRARGIAGVVTRRLAARGDHLVLLDPDAGAAAATADAVAFLAASGCRRAVGPGWTSLPDRP